MLVRKKAKKTKTRPNKFNAAGRSLGLASGKQTVVFNDTGITAWYAGKLQLMSQGPLLNIWRAPIDNDGIKGWENQRNKPLGRWLNAGIDQPSLQHRTLQSTRHEIITETKASCRGGKIVCETHYQVTDDDGLRVTHFFDIDKSLPDLPRIGVRLVLDSSFKDLRWYGRGPHETFIDRQESGKLMVHSSTVSDQYVPYILPQEHGNLTDVRWMHIGNGKQTMKIYTEEPCEASASVYPHESLTPAFHTYELVPSENVYVCLDARQRGVGGASCGPDTLTQYQVLPGLYSLTYKILFHSSLT
jgi:hypothetical protein